MSSFLEDSTEDALLSMLEADTIPPPLITVHYTPEEWVGVEKFHRLIIKKDRSLGLRKDRFPFVKFHLMGVDIHFVVDTKTQDSIH